MAGPPSPCPDDNDCLRLPAASSPRIRGAEKKESTGLRLSQPCPPYVTPSWTSSFGRRLSDAHIVGNVSVTDCKRFCQSSASAVACDFVGYTIPRYLVMPDGQSFRALTSLACRPNVTETSGAQPSIESRNARRRRLA